jgi:hypothetical protein
MEHPFVQSLEKKTLEELQNTISDLTNKLTFAYRTGNAPLIHQLQMVIESYKNEYRRKMDAMLEKQNIKKQINVK